MKILKKSSLSAARLNSFSTCHGVVKTPIFMPIATYGAVKTLDFFDLQNLGAQIILSNTYHLLLRPGTKILKKFKGLHNFMQNKLPLLTDSGGYQVFSLASFKKVTAVGVQFKSHLDGSSQLLTPEIAIKTQQIIGSDIMMCLDECLGYGKSYEQVKQSVQLTTDWAKRCLAFKEKNNKLKNKLFAIIQGGAYLDLRRKSVQDLIGLNFDGFALGGLAVGEPRSQMYKVLKNIVPLLPENKPRYLMGVGYPEEIVKAVQLGVDMFDCVIPSREGRHGRLFFFSGKPLKPATSFYKIEKILNAKFAKDLSPINKNSKLEVLRIYTKAYLHHLFKTNEVLGLRLATLNNLEFYLMLMEKIRTAIKSDQI